MGSFQKRGQIYVSARKRPRHPAPGERKINQSPLLRPRVRFSLVGLGGFEPPTSPLSGVRSNQLSYRPSSKPVLRNRTRAARARTPISGSSSLCGRSRMRITLCSLKEVIQPQVPLRLPCYDFTPVMNHTVVSALPKVRLPTSGTAHSHGVTGGVYKARPLLVQPTPMV